MLPDMDGVTICQKLRSTGNHTPILLLTARGQLTDKVLGLDAGADDYLTKPFAFEELLARIRALSRRPKNGLGPILTASDLSLDTVAKTVSRAGVNITLSATEYAILHYLLRNKSRVVSKSQLISHVWDYDSNVLPNTVEVNIRNLRTKIGPDLIHTIRGFGYKIQVDS
jgi:DNA-binding response OmpR family regulator